MIYIILKINKQLIMLNYFNLYILITVMYLLSLDDYNKVHFIYPIIVE